MHFTASPGLARGASKRLLQFGQSMSTRHA